MGLFKNKSDYQRQCEAKIKELCGGFLPNDEFVKRAVKFNHESSKANTFEKSVLKHECEDGTLTLEGIEDRLDELLQLDCETLDLKIRSNQKQDTSKFKTQLDIERFMGDEYAVKYHEKITKKAGKVKSNNDYDKSDVSSVESSVSGTDELVKLAELYEKGFLTKEEFDFKKRQILGIDDENISDVRPKFCSNCGEPVKKEGKFCSNCGMRI